MGGSFHFGGIGKTKPWTLGELWKHIKKSQQVEATVLSILRQSAEAMWGTSAQKISDVSRIVQNRKVEIVYSFLVLEKNIIFLYYAELMLPICILNYIADSFPSSL